MFNDYATEAAPSFTALLHGHIATFLQNAPSYGATFLLRAPFALPASLAGASTLLVYRLAALPCLLAIAALGVWLARNLRRAGGSALAAAAALVLCAANPITYKVLAIGHPEELLGAALCVAAVLLAQRGRANWAALALGLAIANKQWALLAIGPVLVALPAQRWRTLIIAGAVAVAFVAPIMLSTVTVQAGTSRRDRCRHGPVVPPLAGVLVLWPARALAAGDGQLHSARLPTASAMARRSRAPADRLAGSAADAVGACPSDTGGRRAAVARAADAAALLA